MAQDNQALRQQLLDITESYSCMPEYANMKTFFSNPNNIQGIQDAQNKYGIPPANRSSFHTGLGIFGKWHDFCDRDAIGKFFAFANISMKYPTYSPTDQANCQAIKTALVSLNSAKANIPSTTNADITKSLKAAYDDKIADYNTLYASLTCDTYIANQAQIKAATASVDTALNTITGGNTYIKYALYGAVAYFGFVYIKRLVKGDSK
jgi:hypothetical protein